MKRRWAERREEMESYLARANASESVAKRNRTRWQTDRERMTAIATANARRGAEAITGTHYSPERSQRASAGQRGKVMGGAGARGPKHYFARSFALRSPDGVVYRGRNIIDFVRTHPELFEADDLRERAGTCRAAKCLSRLRPTVKSPASSWKGWTWVGRGRK